MNNKRLHDILNQTEIIDIFYNNKPVWVQEVHDRTVKIGFLDGSEEKNVNIEDLYE
ncbi:MAG: H-type small acid-soluble spore protein [Clostridia bacterium]|nr:H-type small acid-soluble spore protein [Clostridia bacterium]